MLKFGLEIVLGMIQKSDAAIFEILIFRDFSGGQSPNFRPNARLTDILICVLTSFGVYGGVTGLAPVYLWQSGPPGPLQGTEGYEHLNSHMWLYKAPYPGNCFDWQAEPCEGPTSGFPEPQTGLASRGAICKMPKKRTVSLETGRKT